jgi:hypothetical protein
MTAKIIRSHYRPVPIIIIDSDFADVFDATPIDGVWQCKTPPRVEDVSHPREWLN